MRFRLNTLITRWQSMFVLIMLLGLLMGLGCSVAEREPMASESVVQPVVQPEEAIVRIGDAAFSVDLAVLPEERQQGLSGREFMAESSGMLFVFEEESQLHFWMKEMMFPLDIIWIDAQCQLLEVAENVPRPPPGTSNSEIPRVQSPSPALYVLEINAGMAAGAGLSAGDAVRFEGAIEGEYGC